MVGQHDAARANADALRAAAHMREQHRRGGAGNARHAMVLGQPITVKAAALGMLGQAQ